MLHSISIAGLIITDKETLNLSLRSLPAPRSISNQYDHHIHKRFRQSLIIDLAAPSHNYLPTNVIAKPQIYILPINIIFRKRKC